MVGNLKDDLTWIHMFFYIWHRPMAYEPEQNMFTTNQVKTKRFSQFDAINLQLAYI